MKSCGALTGPFSVNPMVHAAAAGDLAALGALYETHGAAVYSTAYRILGNRDDAQDVLQDVFVGLPLALSSYRESGAFDGWIHQVATRTALMRVRSQQRRREADLDDLTIDAAARSNPDAASLAMIDVRRALATLAEPLRIVFMLREVEGYTHAEIAGLLDITAGASATRLSRAWDHLRKEMSP